jgi:hypothetical protein
MIQKGKKTYYIFPGPGSQPSNRRPGDAVIIEARSPPNESRHMEKPQIPVAILAAWPAKRNNAHA